ncbi:NAD(P)-binding protein [Mycena olivaceomarginata]|nr:NAD(P)-binding protein [Mycena olivaceomarginata]
MTITQDPTAPLVAVVGATGAQGGSVINALAESKKPYRIRGFTRDSTKPASQQLIAQGVEMHTISLVLANLKSVFEAFAGASMVFLVTNFWEHLDAERETAEAKMMIDAAKAAGVNRIVWSGLPDYSKLSGGKYTHVVHFDGKAAVAEYGRRSGVPFVDVQAGYYASNLLSPGRTPIKGRTDGAFAIRVPVSPTTSLPVFDAERDYGLYVGHVLEAPVLPDGAEVRTGEYLTIAEMALQISQATGKRVVAEQIPMEQYEKEVAAKGLPPHVVLDMSDGYNSIMAGKISPSVEGLARTPISFSEFAKTADWTKVLV